jgi:hypothetical protein
LHLIIRKKKVKQHNKIMDRNRIPATQAAFSSYLQIADDYLHEMVEGETFTRGENLGMTGDELLSLHEFSKNWRSGDPLHPGVFDMHCNPNTKTPTTHKDVTALMKEFGLFFRPVLARISVSRNIDSSARVTLRIAPPVSTRKRHKVKISETCWAKVTQAGGGSLRLSCSTAHESSRASKPPKADALEIAYILQLPKFDENGNHIPLAGVGCEECNERFISTKSIFILPLGTANVCKIITIFARWINTRNPHLAGSWTGPIRAVIS